MEKEPESRFGWYEWKGKIYHVANCHNCGASVSATQAQRDAETPEGSWLYHLDAIIPCCDKPDYCFDCIPAWTGEGN